MKQKFKQILNFFLYPSKAFACCVYVCFFASLIAMITCLCFFYHSPVIYVCYTLMGITFFYGLYIFIRFDLKRIKSAYKNLKDGNSSKSKFFNKITSDIYFRTMLTTIISMFLGICFVAYNAVAGIIYHSVWNGSISVYFGFLVGIKILFLIGEYRIQKSVPSIFNLELKRAQLLRLEGFMLVLLNLALVVPITLLVLSKKAVILPMWVAIANATYAFYKMGVCIYSFAKSRATDNLSIQGIKNLNLASACVTMLSLENTLIVASGKTITNTLKLIMILSAFAVIVINMWIAISTISKSKKEIASIKQNQI